MIAVIALVVFGPQRLPEIARTVGKALSEFKRQAGDLREEFGSSLELEDDEVDDGEVEDEHPKASVPPAPDRDGEPALDPAHPSAAVDPSDPGDPAHPSGSAAPPEALAPDGQPPIAEPQASEQTRLDGGQ